MNNPTPNEIKAARKAVNLTQTQAAEIVFSQVRPWQQWEHGDRKMHPAFFELFQIKTKKILNKIAKKATQDMESKVSRY